MTTHLLLLNKVQTSTKRDQQYLQLILGGKFLSDSFFLKTKALHFFCLCKIIEARLHGKMENRGKGLPMFLISPPFPASIAVAGAENRERGREAVKSRSLQGERVR